MKLRVAMAVERFPQEPFLAQQVVALLKRSVDVHVLCQIHDTDSNVHDLLDGVDMGGRVHPWPDRGRPAALAAAAGNAVAKVLTRPKSRTSAMAALRAERSRTEADRGLAGRILFDARVLAIQPDVLHFQFGDLARDRVHVAGAVDVAFTSSFRGYDLTYAGLEHPDFYHRLWPVLDGAHTLGQDLHRLAVERGAPETLDWSIIPPAVDLSRFKPSDHGRRRNLDQPLRIVSVGRLHWKKGIPDGLAAVAGLKATGQAVRYRIVGDGPAEEELRWAVQDLGLLDSVELLGPRDAAGVREQLAWADIFLHPALTEGFGNAVLEAQAMGLPVVCTDAEGLRENVVDGETGHVVPRRQPEAMTAALVTLAADAGRRHAMGERGRQRVEDHFSLEDQTDAFIEFLSRAAERAKRRVR